MSAISGMERGAGQQDINRQESSDNRNGAHNGSDATANLAERRVELREKMHKVEDTVRDAVGDNKSLYEYLLEYVTTEGATFHWMKQKGIPCERTYFYEVRRYFYYLMAKRI